MAVLIHLKVSLQDGIPVIDVDGELDHSATPELRTQIANLVGQGHRSVVMDMSHVSFMDSGGISLIIYAMKRLAAVNGGVILAGCNNRIIRKLGVGGLTRISDALKLAPSVEQAIRGLKHTH